jgi:nicotinamide-nucleotide amidase
MEEHVIPKLLAMLRLPAFVHHHILTANIGESLLAETISVVEDQLPDHISLAYLPKLGMVRLRLSGRGTDPAQLSIELAAYAKKITDLIGEFIIAEADVPLEKVILGFMESRKLTLSVAESCTGGYLSHLITQHPGSSQVYLGGAVSYSNQLKTSMLGVSEHTLEKHGAVSEETVREMAAGALSHYRSDYAVSVSGIAGPDGGTEEKPVGTVWIAVSGPAKTISRKFLFKNKRIQNIERSAVSALSLLYQLLKEEHI